MASYGLPYMGSKNAIAENIIRLLPKAKRLVDLFAGGVLSATPLYVWANTRRCI